LLAGLCAAALLMAPVATPLRAQDVAAKPAPPSSREGEAMPTPELSPAARAAIDAPFLKPDEAKDLRVRHGIAEPGDLDTPARKARWALLRGRFDDPALLDANADRFDRADSALLRGEPEQALALVGDDASMRAVRIRVAALESLGKPEAMLAAAVPALNFLVPGQHHTPESALQIVDAVEVQRVIARSRPPANRPGDEYRAMLKALRTARESLDRLEPGVPLMEAQLLFERDNAEEAQQALEQALSLNPSCAEAWLLLGQMAVNAFDLGNAEKIALRLEELAGPTSAGAAQIRARAMLRQNDPDLAETGLKPALGAMPRRRALLELQAAVTALRFDQPGLEKLLSEYDALSPASPRAYYEAGRALSEARQYEWAARLLEEAVRRAPDWPQPVIDLGLLYVQSGQDDLAFETCKKANELDPFNVRAHNSFNLIKEILAFDKVESEHFIVRFRPGVDRLLAQEMLPVLEDNHRRVTGKPEQTPGGLDHSPAQRTLIDLMPNHRWFAVRIAGMPRIHTIAAATGPIIAMEAPREGRDHTGTYDWPRVLRHEYTHTVGLSRTRNRIPHWFTEAQSVYLEQAPRDYPTCKMLAEALLDDELFDFVQINIAFVRPKRPQDRSMAYAQGHWMYEYLVETFGPRAPLKLMDRYAQGVREEQAYQEVLQISREQFFANFKAWARDQVRAWGLLPPLGTPTLRELLDQQAQASPDTKPEPDAAFLAKHLATHPNHPELLELQVEQTLAANQGQPTQDMVPLLQRYAAARPVDPAPHKHLARLYLASAQPDDPGPQAELALPHLEYLDAREDRVPTYAAQLAAIYAQRGELEQARDKAERAVRIAPYDARQRERAAGIALQRSDPQQAFKHIYAMTQLEPDQPIHRQRLEAVSKLIESKKGG
jgi:tetratricopeptide (TPR) repeat protein